MYAHRGEQRLIASSPRTRRSVVQQIGGVVAVGLLTSCALPAVGAPPKTHRIGVIWFGPDLAPDLPHFAAFRKGLSDFGYIEGTNLLIEWRYGQQDLEKMTQLADELVQLDVGVIFAPGLLALQAAKQATTTIPIVGITNDPVGMGQVASLARPGGNVTGIATLLTALAAKRVEVFKEAIPSVSARYQRSRHAWPTGAQRL